MKKFLKNLCFLFVFFGFIFAFVQSPVFAEELSDTVEESVKVKIVGLEKFCRNNTDKDCETIVVKVQDGSKKGNVFNVENSYPSVMEKEDPFKIGKIYYATLTTVDGKTNVYIGEIYRLPGILFLFFAFVLIVVIFGRKQGIYSLLALVLNFVVLVFVIVPGVYHKVSPGLLIMTAGTLLMFLTLFFTYGFNRKALSAFTGSVFGLAVTSILTYFFIDFTSMTGLASEESGFLLDFIESVNLKDILFVGIVVGMMGVLDDVTIGQASTVFQIADANTKLSVKEVYKKAIVVGKDHVASMVNTLIIAYAGASFPLFLLLANNPGGDLLSILNMEIISVEILNMMVGSIGFILTVPITTYVACRLAIPQKR